MMRTATGLPERETEKCHTAGKHDFPVSFKTLTFFFLTKKEKTSVVYSSQKR